jgi:hypothetical protein
MYISSFDEHLAHLREVFTRFRNAGLTVNLSKVKFACSQLSFLGQLISFSGVSIDPDRTVAFRNYRQPTDVKGVVHFINMVNFFHKFIPDLARRAAPLKALMKKGVKLKWGEEEQAAFLDLKMCVMNPVLAMTDFTKRFIGETDESSSALGAVPLQEMERHRRVVAFASRSPSVQENFSAYELEYLAVLFELENFRMEFDLETDNHALSWCLGHPRQTGRIARWGIRLSAFKFFPHHIKGNSNVVADALSHVRRYGNSRASSPCSANAV